MYMHFWYAMHRYLWWCLVDAITIVQCIFGALFLRLQYIIGVASLVVCIVSYIAQACYRSGASTLFGRNNPQNSNQYIAAGTD